MRMLMTVKMPHGPFNVAIKDGTASAKMNRLLEATRPEAAYFTTLDGQRAALLIVDLSDPAKIPSLAEPWFLTFEADVDIDAVMSLDDMKRAGIDEVGKAWA